MKIESGSVWPLSHWPGLFALGSLVALTVRGDVRINELFYHPASELDREEWLELVNTGTNRVDVSGWRFTEGVRFTIPPNTRINPGGFLVVAADAGSFATNHPGVTPVVAGWEGILSNSGQQVQLVDAAGKPVDSVRYADDGEWADRVRDAVDYGHRGWAWQSAADGLGASLELRQLALPNGLGRNWAPSTVPGGTPGAPNSTATTNLPPLITEVRHRPLVPKATEAVTVIARLVDEGTPATLTGSLHWHLDGAAGFNAVPLLDDGQHGDGAPADGVFAATIPAQTNGAIVEFYLSATDAQTQTRTWPAPALMDGAPQQVANALYQVDAAASLAALKPGELPRYRLILTAADRAELESINRNSPPAPFPQPSPFNDQTRSRAQFNATFISQDGTGTELRYLIGVRNRGNGSRTKSPPGLRLHLRNDELWRKSSALNLNSQYTPAQLLGSALYQRAGLAAADSRPVHLRVNNRDLHTTGSPNYGFYVANEVINSEFAARAFPEDSSGNLYRGIRLTGDGADLAFLGTNAAPYRENYFKQSNTSQDDWRDLIELCRVLDDTSDAEFAAAVRRTVNVDSWMRYFALETLVDNRETDLGNGNNGTGEGDDYHLYFGRNDPRARVVPYDLDTILGLGDTSFNVNDGLFRMAANPQVSRFVKHPEFAPAYYGLLLELAHRDFAPERFNSLVDEVLVSLASDSIRQNFKDFAAARRAGVLAQIPVTLSATNGSVALVNGIFQTAGTSISLHGFAPAVSTRSVTVNGQPAQWSAWDAAWTNPAVALRPGLNRLVVRSHDASGAETDQLIVSVASTAAAGTSVGGNLAGSVTWTAASGPYRITSSLTVTSGGTLTIEPGTTLYLGAGVNFTVANGGRLLAEGTATAPIVFAKDPAAASNWGGLVLNGGAGSPETRIAFAHFDGNGATAIHTVGATVVLDHLTFGNPARQYLSLDASSFIVSHCHFPDATAEFEALHGNDGIKPGGVGILRHCYVGKVRGYNDAFDFTGGNRPGEPILQIINNVFAGSGDDLLDLDGTDAWIEGNLFLHTHKNGSPDSASAVSGGSGGGETSEVTVIGNLFYDCDQAVTAKQGNFYTVLNNTIVRITKDGGLDTESAVLNLADNGTSAGAGFHFAGNVITDADALTRNYNAASSSLTFVGNALPVSAPGAATNNLVAEPVFVHWPDPAETVFGDFEAAQILRQWFRQTSTSPTRTIPGFEGTPGVQITGAPAAVDRRIQLTLAVAPWVQTGIPAVWNQGAGFTHYRWRLDEGTWSEPVPAATPLSLAGLTEGQHQLEVTGQNDAGLWQDSPLLGDDAVPPTVLRWTVAPDFARLVLSELLARNDRNPLPDGSLPDLVELFNDSAAPQDLAGYGLGQNPNGPPAFRFPAGTTIAAGGYLVLTADADLGARPLNLPFGLKASGDTLVLFNPAGEVLDSVTFGPQLADRSLGRWDTGSGSPCRDRQWTLTEPTFGAANRPVALGSLGGLHLNEWLAAAASQFADDFVELYNAEPLPVRLDGVYLTDNPVGEPLRHALPPFTFMEARGYLALIADGNAAAGGNHVPFKLASENGVLQISAATPPCVGFPAPAPTDFTPLDTVFYGPQFADVAQGRSPNGSSTLRYLPTPTPGAGNPGGSGGETNITTVTFDLVTFTNSWRYYQAGAPAAGWQATTFDDSAWAIGNALFHFGGDTFTVPLNTPLTRGKSAYYFRTHFTAATNDPSALLRLQTLIDDGAVVWLNGHELYRQNLSQAVPAYADYAGSVVSTASLNGPNDVPATWLQPGENLLAVEVHQANSGSSDLTFALRLFQSLSQTNIGTGLLPPVLNEVLARNYGLQESDGTYPEWIELHNPNAQALDVSGLALTDDPAQPNRFVFAPGTVLAPHGFLRVRLEGVGWTGGNSPAIPAAAFKLDGDGDQVFLLDTAANSRALLDSVAFGLQLHDRSIGRVPDATGNWQLAEPSAGATNRALPLGDAAKVTVNEWMPNPASGDDWFELHNPGALPVELSGWHLTDDLTAPAKHTLPPLSFLGTGADGFVRIVADGSAGGAGNHVGFKLDNKGESLGLANPDGTLVSQISYAAATKGVSEGRFPDSSATIVRFPTLPTPGASNRADADRDGLPDDWELAHLLSAADPADALADADGDGRSNRDEFFAGTDPQNAASSLRVELPAQDGITVTLRFTAGDGIAYGVEAADDLELAVWTKLANIAARPGSRTLQLTVPQGALPRYFRVVVD